MKTYIATRTRHGCRVWVHPEAGHRGYRLRPRLDLWNHSPTGYEWGYGGSGPAQLALALLADLYQDDVAIDLHQAFKFRVIARITATRWAMPEDEIRRLVQAMPQAQGRQLTEREKPCR